MQTQGLIEEIEGAWYVVWAVRTLTAITSLRREAGKLQYKTTEAAVFILGDESATWTEVDGQDDIEAQDVITDFRVDALTLRTKTRSVYVDPAAAEGDWDTVHTCTEDCPAP